MAPSKVSRVPLSTCRLQFTPSFGFKEARDIVEYLDSLGISDIYASPIFKAKKGSSHGYDVVDPNQLNPDLGTIAEFEELSREVKKYKMGWLQDVVPNHMAFDSENQMLMDVLENGQRSEYVDFFDIEWFHPYEPGTTGAPARGRVLAPFLGKLYGESLESGEIQLRYCESGFTINYYDWRLPLAIESYADVLTYDRSLQALKRKLGRAHPDFVKLLGILYVLKTLSSEQAHLAEESSELSSTELSSQVAFVKGMLREIYTGNEEVKKFIDGNIEAFNGKKGDPESFNHLDSLLSAQLFRLSFWKVANEEINYRRFFNINGLISLRMEDKHAFHKFHALILGLLKNEKFTGLRIDHLDGLYNPAEYLDRLRGEIGETYLLVEKILNLKEGLPASWPVQGTTGYEFLNYLNEIFCERRNGKKFQRMYSDFTGLKTPYEDLLYEKKRLIIEKSMAGDVDRLAHLLKRISAKDRHGSDITLNSLKKAMVELLAIFPVYRTYVSYNVFNIADRSYVSETIKKARRKEPGLLYEFNFIERFLLLNFGDYQSDEEKNEWVNFTMKFQQLTGPLMAKGLEDTTFYIYNRLLSFNEVGGNPSQFGISIKEFHTFNRKRANLWPHSLNATSTHDTKRGEDVRARINVLSEIPAEWERNFKLWSKINRLKKPLPATPVSYGRNAPDRNDEYFLYQTLIGAFPFCAKEYSFYEKEYPDLIERIKNYIIKAIREAKVHTAWIKPDTDYEEAFTSFIDRILKPSEQNRFLEEFLPFQKKVAFYGILNSLSQTLIKITSPGVPDFYQGTELWDLNLVDPDNRRPVDFKKRQEFLGKIRDNDSEQANLLQANLLQANLLQDRIALIDQLLSTPEDGMIKLFLIYRALMARAEKKDTFQQGDYISLESGGKFKNHIIVFARKSPSLPDGSDDSDGSGRVNKLNKKKNDYRNKSVNSWAITIAPRLLTHVVKENEYPLGRQVWDDTYLTLPKGSPLVWKDSITAQVIEGGQNLPIGDVLKHFPVALLMGEEQANPEQANLEQANLEQANLEQTNLEQTNLEQTNLEQANPLEEKK